MKTVVMVAVDNAAFKFDKLYSYTVPKSLDSEAVVGAHVLVPFGKGVPRAGVVLAKQEQDAEALKDIIDIEHGKPILDAEMVSLIRLLRETTFCTYYDAVRTVLPRHSRWVADRRHESLRKESHENLETVFCYLRQTPAPRLTEKQKAVCDLVFEAPMTAAEITKRIGVTRGVTHKLAERGILKKEQRVKALNPIEIGVQADIPDLTEAQRDALERIAGYMDEKGKTYTTLLHGVTSSGKTVLYIKLIERAVQAKKSAMILVPEIALATQMIARLRAMFGRQVAIWHSALSDAERQTQWEKIRSGECTIVVGTRSAVFAPLVNPAIFIVDEEQEGSYISEQSPRYAAVRIADYRAKYHGAHLLLASATPSVESYYFAKTGRYHLVELLERYGKMPLPAVRVVDMRSELFAGNSHHISAYLKEEIDARIEKNEQCILLLNRRGYRTVSMCRRCRAVIKCVSCDTPLVIHKPQERYVCHYCGQSFAIQETCAQCEGAVMHTGIGTQKIEEELEGLFPTARILRLDLDTASRRNALEQHLNDFSAGKYDIIIGTQMIAKGLDFENVTLVGVLSVDQLLLMPSFRASEKTFSMLTQVVGRSGRGSKKGEAVIQTIDPENDIIRLAAKQDYEGFYKDEIISRKTHLYPPFCGITTIGFIAEKEDLALAAAMACTKIIQQIQREEYAAMPIRVLGPSPMRVSYVNNLYRYRLVLKHRSDAGFRSFLRRCMDLWSKGEYAAKTRMFVDTAGEPDNG